MHGGVLRALHSSQSIKRLSRVSGPTVLVNHWPLVQETTLRMAWPEIALWCGTRHTRSWARRYNAQAVIYGHLHLPSETSMWSTPSTLMQPGRCR